MSLRAPFWAPYCFPCIINDISADIESEIRLFADDCVCYREIKNEEDTLKLQRDIDRLGSWARKWGMRFQPVKCNMMQLTNKRSSKIQANYTLEDTLLENVESIKYLGVTITNDLKWKGTSRQRSGKGAIRKRFPLQKPRWEKTKLTVRYLYHETYRKPNEQLFSQ